MGDIMNAAKKKKNPFHLLTRQKIQFSMSRHISVQFVSPKEMPLNWTAHEKRTN